MSVFARVVVGVDGTVWGFEALRQTLTLAPAGESVVDAVTALDIRPAIHTGLEATYFADLLAQEAAAARGAAGALLADRTDASARVVRGEPVLVLRRARDEGAATLLALGGRRSSRFLGVLIGATASELLHDAVCSVLLARPQADGEWRPRRVAVGLDGSPHALAALRAADELAARLGSATEVVAATGDSSPRPEGGWADRVDTWESAHPVPALLARSADADLLVVGSRGVHGVRALGSVSEHVAHRAACSVLVVHETA